MITILLESSEESKLSKASDLSRVLNLVEKQNRSNNLLSRRRRSEVIDMCADVIRKSAERNFGSCP